MSSRQLCTSAPPGTISSPSRSPFRPPLSLTFLFRVQSSSSASTYLGPVLGARRNLGAGKGRFKGVQTRGGRNLRKFNFPHFHSRPCSLWITPTPQRLESSRAPLPPSVDLPGLRRVRLGPLLRSLHLAWIGVGGRLRRDRVHHRRGRRLPDLPLRAGLRRGRAAAALTSQAEDQQAR